MVSAPGGTAAAGETAAQLRRLDLAHVLHPHATVGRAPEPLIVDSASGATLRDIDGNSYIDGTCGLWQCAVGHGRAELAEVAAEQMRRLEFYASFWHLSNPQAIRLAERLAGIAPEGLNTVFYTNGGSEGNETAVKLARLAWHASGQPERTVILSRQGAYHGVGSASLAATGLPAFHDGFGPLTPGFVHLSKPHGKPYGTETTDVLVAELERTIAEIGPERIAAFIGEPLLGVGGMVPPPPGYWERVQRVLREHGILLILDEIVTAFGRLGHWFGAEHYGIEPDIAVTAKGLSSGYVPMGAVLIGDGVMGMLDGTPFRHGFTYNGHPVGAAVSLANIDIIESEGLLDRARTLGARILDGLGQLEGDDRVAEVRGAGMAFGVELALDDATPVADAAREHGVLVRAAGSTIVLSPPLVLTEAQADTLVDAVTKAVRAL
ncbi:aspartate aminotransferase family protein [Haloechinothrix sp. YIM 98757]|uniref:Aspartate aminotransferase family protein n=1 Tax=Haloechinothrix aidingensis TaxID=2752311 RepID=A0A838ABM7_9PSEU|nr:aspartate aminotransferase family protein [Haloechinothrix aidingensis]MBA0126631.1 aspartate aminotransferase family protein [Haloechinothrix aidingensis]